MAINNDAILSILSGIGSLTGAQPDRLGEFVDPTPTKEDLVKGNKEATNFKWMAFDVVKGIAETLINQKRQKTFEHLQENAEAAAEAELKERQKRLDNLKGNLGITQIEQKLEAQEKTLNDIKAILGQLQSAVDKQKDKDKKVKDKDLHFAKVSKKKEVEEDEEFT